MIVVGLDDGEIAFEVDLRARGETAGPERALTRVVALGLVDAREARVGTGKVVEPDTSVDAEGILDAYARAADQERL